MSRVWFAVPVAESHVDEAAITFAKWKDQGYSVIVYAEHNAPIKNADLVIRADEYKGWASSVNKLVQVLLHDKGVEWIVTGGADVDPDPDAYAVDFAGTMTAHFGGTFGVCQPCGDVYGALATREACVSPWMGREWCERSYRGSGPLWAGYKHYYADTELAAVATREGVMWWRDEMTHYHHHYLRQGRPTPEHLVKWQPLVGESKKLYDRRKVHDFPGSEVASAA